MEEKIISIVADILSMDESQISLESTIDSLSIDSLDLFEIAIRIEEELCVDISGEDIINAITLNDLLLIMKTKGA
jgi:acyl carrier protein